MKVIIIFLLFSLFLSVNSLYNERISLKILSSSKEIKEEINKEENKRKEVKRSKKDIYINISLSLNDIVSLYCNYKNDKGKKSCYFNYNETNLEFNQIYQTIKVYFIFLLFFCFFFYIFLMIYLVIGIWSNFHKR